MLNLKIKDSLMQACIQSLQQIIQIKSVKSAPEPGHPFGRNVSEALDYILVLGHSMGFKTCNLDNYAGYIEIGDGTEELGILVHVDVVPEGEVADWKYDPYGGVIAEGKIWGRGTLDDKGPAIAVLYAMKLLADQGVKLSKRVRLIIGADEESGWQDIEYYLRHEQPPAIGFTPDGCFPVTNSEKGIITFDICSGSLVYSGVPRVERIVGGVRPNVVPDHAFAVLKGVTKSELAEAIALREDASFVTIEELDAETVKLKMRGTVTHSSTPDKGINAIDLLLRLLIDLKYESDPLYDFLSFYSEQLADDWYGLKIGCAAEDEVSGKLTLCPTLIEYENGKSLTISFNLRYPSTKRWEDISLPIQEAVAKRGLALRVMEHKPPVYLPVDHELVRKLMTVYNDYCQKDEKPVSIAGGTFARAFNNMVAFGALFPNKPLLAHEPNEHIELDVIEDWVRIYSEAIAALAGEGPEAEGERQ